MADAAAQTLPEFLRTQPIDQALREAIQDLAAATRTVAHRVERGPLTGVLGSADTSNIQGETQKKLDVICNDLLLEHLQTSGHWAGIASEEMDHAQLPHKGCAGEFLCVYDPLDGSSNIDVNGGVGTIFSVLPNPAGTNQPDDETFRQVGDNQRAAIFTLYGPATVLVLTTGHGVATFALDPDGGEYLLTNGDVRLPADTSDFAVNVSNHRRWSQAVQRYVDECLQGTDGPREKDFNMRYVGAMVADMYRILLQGGIFFYPKDMGKPQQPGKLRLLYEGNPMGFIVEQAGGAASDGTQRLMAIDPADLHQRCAVFMGSRREVERIEDYHRQMG
jgi:fructose-1,6-bisphosphatase I